MMQPDEMLVLMLTLIMPVIMVGSLMVHKYL